MPTHHPHTHQKTGSTVPRSPASASSRSAARRRWSTRSRSSRNCAPKGYAIAPSYDGADLVVVNTCGFIDAAVAESLDAIGEALAENGKVIVTGCLGAKDGGALRARRASRRCWP